MALVFALWPYCAGAGRKEGVGAPLPRSALTTAVVISGTGDKHYFPSNSLIMSVLPHGWLSKANPEPLTPAEGLCVQGEIYCVCVCVCVCPERPEDELHACFVRVQPSFPAFIYTPCFYLLFFSWKPLSCTLQPLLRSLSFVRQWLAAGVISSNLSHFVISVSEKCCISYFSFVP